MSYGKPKGTINWEAEYRQKSDLYDGIKALCEQLILEIERLTSLVESNQSLVVMRSEEADALRAEVEETKRLRNRELDDYMESYMKLDTKRKVIVGLVQELLDDPQAAPPTTDWIARATALKGDDQ